MTHSRPALIAVVQLSLTDRKKSSKSMPTRSRPFMLVLHSSMPVLPLGGVRATGMRKIWSVVGSVKKIVSPLICLRLPSQTSWPTTRNGFCDPFWYDKMDMKGNVVRFFKGMSDRNSNALDLRFYWRSIPWYFWFYWGRNWQIDQTMQSVSWWIHDYPMYGMFWGCYHVWWRWTSWHESLDHW